MFKIGDEVTCINDLCDFYESLGNARDSNIIFKGEKYKIIRVRVTTRNDDGYGTSPSGTQLIRIETPSGNEWWVKANCFKLYDEQPMNLPDWF